MQEDGGLTMELRNKVLVPTRMYPSNMIQRDYDPEGLSEGITAMVRIAIMLCAIITGMDLSTHGLISWETIIT